LRLEVGRDCHGDVPGILAARTAREGSKAGHESENGAMRSPAAQKSTLPPLWLAASALAAGITVAFGIQRWIAHFSTDPTGEDTRVWIIAARIGLSRGWSHIYDLDLQRAQAIDLAHIYLSPPPAAWLTVPLAGLPVAAGYLIWTLVNLAALCVVCWMVCPGTRFVRLTVLFVSLAIWPMHYQFWQGQWVVADLVFLALAWWLLDRDRPLLAGVMLAIPFFFKPQDVALVPVALLVSGRWRPIASFIAVGGVLALASVASLGMHGLTAWFNDVALARANPFTGPMTYSTLFGRGAAATATEAALALLALGLAWYRRDRLDLVFTLGIVGTTASAFYLHEDDVAILVLGAWIALRARPSIVHRGWLLLGIAAAQFVSLGLAIPMLLWEAGWIGVLGLEPRLQAIESVRRLTATEARPAAEHAVTPR
jgi:Glycosyltransferase family 87